MQKQRGFTIVELLIVLVVVFILGVLIVTIVRSVSDPNFNYCDTYRYSSVRDVPVSCFDYLTNGGGSQK